jgi:tRNA uridine 5-carboxymethylaminomethyl modification enzyme
VLIDDLVTKGTQEPYRMFTSRAEFRILLRQDNADLRLTAKGYELGLATEERFNLLSKKKAQIESLTKEIKTARVEPAESNDTLLSIDTSVISEKVSAAHLLKRPEVGIQELRKLSPALDSIISRYDAEVSEQVEITVKYEPYIDREQILAEKISTLENYRIRPDFDYDRVKALSSEAREKLKKLKPETIGQMSRISGVSPADVSIMTVYLGR